jgi:cobalt/nickel transport protein
MSTTTAHRVSNRALLLGILLVSLLLAGIISFYASGSPDGLESVAEDEGFLQTAEDSATAGSPFADYGTEGVDDERASVGVAGVLGVLVTLALASGIAYVVTRRRPTDERAERDDATSSASSA